MKDKLYRKLLISLPLIVITAIYASSARHHFSWAAFVQFCQGMAAHLWFYLLPLIAILALIRSVYIITRSRRKVATLEVIEDKRAESVLEGFASHKDRVSIFRSHMPAAFTAGIIKPHIYISTALLDQLNESELKAVIAHEIGHVNKKDPFWSVLATLARDMLLLLPIAHWLYSQYKIEAEYDCDRTASKRIGDSLTVADAILKVHKGSRSGFSGYPVTAMPGLSSTAVEKRIKYLLGEKQGSKYWPVPLLLTALSLFMLAFLIGISGINGANQLCGLN